MKPYLRGRQRWWRPHWSNSNLVWGPLWAELYSRDEWQVTLRLGHRAWICIEREEQS